MVMDKETELTCVSVGKEVTEHLVRLTKHAGLQPQDMVPVIAAVISNCFGALKAIDQENAKRNFFGLYGGMIGLGAALDFHRIIHPDETHKFLYRDNDKDDIMVVKH